MQIIETCPKCGHDLMNLVLTTYPPIPQKKCFSCGWSWTGEPEKVVRVPFGGNATNVIEQPSLNDYINTLCELKDLTTEQSPCDSCPNNVKNGGSGNCNCILGLPKVTC